MFQIIIPYHNYYLDSKLKNKNKQQESKHKMFNCGEINSYSYDVIFKVWKILRILRKWKRKDRMKICWVQLKIGI